MDPISPRPERTPQSPQERPKGLRRGLSAVRIADDKGSVHTYNEEEKQGLVDIVNDLLKDDPQLSDVIPIDPASQDIFDSVNDGVLLCKLVNTIRPRTIDSNRINTKSDLKLFEKLENLTEAVNGTQTALNMPLVNIGVNDLLEGKPVLVLAVLWQLINLHLHTQVARTAHIVRLDYLLKDEAEKSTDDEQLRILLRWFNHHLSDAKHTRRVSNLAGDIRDSENYLILLHQLAPKECTLEARAEPDLLKRATLLLQQAARIGCKKFLGPSDIVQGNSRLNFAFLANLFTKFQRAPSPPPVVVVPEVVPAPKVPLPAIEIEKIKIVEERKKIQDEVKAKEIQQLQKAIIIAKELMNLPSAEKLEQAIVKEEKETAKIQKETEHLHKEVVVLTEQAEESRLITKKAQEEYDKVEQEVTKMVVKHEKEVSHIKAKLDHGVAKVASLKKQLDEAVVQSTKLTQVKTHLVAEKEVLEKKIDVETRDTNRLTRLREKLDAEMTNTKKTITKVQTSRTQVEIAITKVEKQIQEINNDIVDINKSILKVDHYTSIAKEDLEQEKERVAIIHQEKTRLVARKNELEDEMYTLQEKLQQEEDHTQQALQREKEKAREEYTKFVLAADRELYDVVYKKDAELHANVDILARKEAAQVERIIAQAQNQEQQAELREITRQLNDANTEILVTEKRNMKLEEFVDHANRRIVDNVRYNEREAERLSELLADEKEAREKLADKQTETEALEYRRNVLNTLMEDMREQTVAAELAAASDARDARSLRMEIEVLATLPEESKTQRERHQAKKEHDNNRQEIKEEQTHEKKMQRQGEKELAMDLMNREEEQLGVKVKAVVPGRRPKLAVAEDDDMDELLAKANSILCDGI